MIEEKLKKISISNTYGRHSIKGHEITFYYADLKVLISSLLKEQRERFIKDLKYRMNKLIQYECVEYGFQKELEELIKRLKEENKSETEHICKGK